MAGWISRYRASVSDEGSVPNSSASRVTAPLVDEEGVPEVTIWDGAGWNEW
jgi:hypothetical protein